MATAPPPVFPLTTADPASELALKLEVITEAARMAGQSDPQVIAALVHASAIAELVDAIRAGAADLEAGLSELAASQSLP